MVVKQEVSLSLETNAVNLILKILALHFTEIRS